jgi:hypothetical protein
VVEEVHVDEVVMVDVRREGEVDIVREASNLRVVQVDKTRR